MATSSVGYYADFCLLKNPFEPAIADERDPEELILKGTHYIEKMNKIKIAVEGINENTSHVQFVIGPVGSGKTAVIKRALFELDYKLPRGHEHEVFQLTVGRGEGRRKVIGVYLRPQHEDSFKATVARALCSIYEHVTHSSVKNCTELSPSQLAGLVDEALSKAGAIGFFVVLDQLERVSDDVSKGIEFVREIYNAKRHGGLIVVSAVNRDDILRAVDVARRFIRSVDHIELEGLSRSEALNVLVYLLDYYRLPTCKEKVDDYYPFTREGLDILFDYLYSNRLRMSPGIIYEFLGEVLRSAVTHGLTPIGEREARLVLGLIGVVRLEWIDSLNMDPRLFRDAFTSFMQLLSLYTWPIAIPDWGEVKVEGILFTPGKLLEILEYERDVNKNETIKAKIRHAIDYAIVVRTPERMHVAYLIKVLRRATRTLVEAVNDSLSSITGFKFRGRTIVPDNIVYRLVVLDELPRTVLEGLSELRLNLRINVANPLVIRSYDPKTYGALMYIYRVVMERSDFEALINDEAVSTSITVLLEKLLVRP